MDKIEWSQTALEDLEEIYDFIARDSSFHAQITRDGILEKIEMLLQFPQSGKIIFIRNVHNIRMILFQNYKIIYRIFESSIRILRILHQSRDFNLNIK